MLARHSVVMIHDAQTVSTPASYGLMFRAYYRMMQGVIGVRASRILTASEFSRNEIDRYGIAPAAKIDVIHNGADHGRAIIPDGVLCPGRLSNEQLAGLMGQALCLAMPSLTEGFGLPPLQAMYWGRPTVVAPAARCQRSAGMRRSMPRRMIPPGGAMPSAGWWRNRTCARG